MRIGLCSGVCGNANWKNKISLYILDFGQSKARRTTLEHGSHQRRVTVGSVVISQNVSHFRAMPSVHHYVRMHGDTKHKCASD